MARANNSIYVSVCLSNEEKQILDEAAKAAGRKRNRFIREWIASLVGQRNEEH